MAGCYPWTIRGLFLPLFFSSMSLVSRLNKGSSMVYMKRSLRLLRTFFSVSFERHMNFAGIYTNHIKSELQMYTKYTQSELQININHIISELQMYREYTQSKLQMYTKWI